MPTQSHSGKQRPPTDASPAATTRSTVRLIGPPHVAVGSRRLKFPVRAYFLLALLQLQADLQLPRIHLRHRLWGESEQKEASANLRQLLSRIAKAQSAEGVTIIRLDDDRVSMNVADNDIDLGRWQAKAIDGLFAAGRYDELVKLLGESTGELLEGLDPRDPLLEDWLREARTDLRLQMLTTAARLLARASLDPPTRLVVAERLIALDPAHEEGHRARIDALGQMGDLARCRLAYQDCEARLRQELGIAPSKDTRDLAERYLGQLVQAGGRRLRLGSAVAATTGDSPRGAEGIPRLAILPPVMVVEDARKRELAHCFLEDLTIGLARFRSFRVIAAHTAVSIAQGAATRVAGQNWSDYVVASTLMPMKGGRAQLRYRLSSSHTGEVLHADVVNFDEAFLADLYQKLAERTVYILASEVEQAQHELPAASEHPTAYQLYLAGQKQMTSPDLGALRRARKLFQRSSRLDPDFARAHAGVARTLTLEWVLRAQRDTTLLKQAAVEAKRAMDADGQDASGYRELALALLYQKCFDECLQFFEYAIQRNSNDADLLADYADALAHCGQPEAGLEMLHRATALNPVKPPIYRWAEAGIRYQMKQYREAKRALAPVSTYPATARLLSAICARLNDMVEAQRYASIVRDQFPEFSTDDLGIIVPNRNIEDTLHLIQGLKLAGLP